MGASYRHLNKRALHEEERVVQIQRLYLIESHDSGHVQVKQRHLLVIDLFLCRFGLCRIWQALRGQLSVARKRHVATLVQLFG
jgi:hypothetical protein